MRNAAVLDHQDAVGERDRFRHVMRHQDCREGLLAPDPLQQPLHGNPRQRIERAKRLVERQHARIADKCACERDALLLPAGKHRRPLYAFIAEADFDQRLLGACAGADRGAVATEANLDIRYHPRPRQQPRLLEHHPDIFRLRFPAETDGAGIDALKTGDQAQQRTFAAAAAADDRDELPGRDMQVDAAQHLVVAERFAQGPDGERQAVG